MLKNSLRFLVSNNFVISLKYGALWLKWLKIWILVKFLQRMEFEKWKTGLQASNNLHHIMFQKRFFWIHIRFWSFKTCKPYAGPYYGQFKILIHAILLYGQFMTSMQPYVAIFDLVFVSCFLYGGQHGIWFCKNSCFLMLLNMFVDKILLSGIWFIRFHLQWLNFFDFLWNA